MNPLYAQQQPGHIIEVITTDGQPENLFVGVGGTPVATTTALTGLSAAIGSLVYVTSQLRAYLSVPVGQGDVTGTATNDWKSLPETSSPTWRSQSIFFISAAGNDNNSGALIGQPIATVSELAQRLNGQFNVNMSVIFLDNNAGGTLRLARKTRDISIQCFGNQTTVTTDTVGTWTPLSGATNKWQQMTGTAIADFTPYVGMVLNFTTGAAAGGESVVIITNPEGSGVGTIELTQPTALPNSPVNFNPPALVPAPGDSFQVRSQATIDYLSVNVFDADSDRIIGAAQVTVPAWQINNLNVTTLGTTNNGKSLSQGIIWASVVNDWGNAGSGTSNTAFSCLFVLTQPVLPSANYLYCGVKSVNSAAVAFANLAGAAQLIDVVFEGIGFGFGYAFAQALNLGCFRSPSHGLTIGDGFTLQVIGTLLGQGNTLFGVSISAGGKLLNTGATLKLTGTSGDWRLGASTFTWAQVPRLMNQGSLHGTFGVGGTVTVAIPNLPADANIVLTCDTPSGAGAPGVYSVPQATQTTSGFVANSTVAAERSTFEIYWFSPASGNGGVVNG